MQVLDCKTLYKEAENQRRVTQTKLENSERGREDAERKYDKLKTKHNLGIKERDDKLKLSDARIKKQAKQIKNSNSVMPITTGLTPHLQKTPSLRCRTKRSDQRTDIPQTRNREDSLDTRALQTSASQTLLRT